MKQPHFPHRSPTTPSATGYLERLSKALPGAKSRAGSKLSREFWPEGAKLVISISLQFEAGAQPEQVGDEQRRPRREWIAQLASHQVERDQGKDDQTGPVEPVRHREG